MTDFPARSHPAFHTLAQNRWDFAFGYLHTMTIVHTGTDRLQAVLDALGDRKAARAALLDLIEDLYALGPWVNWLSHGKC